MKSRISPLQSARLPDQLRERIRYLDYSQNTGKVYLRRLLHAVRAAENILSCVFSNTQLNYAEDAVFIFIPPIFNAKSHGAHQGVKTDDEYPIPHAGEKLRIARLQRRPCLRSAMDQYEAAMRR